MKKLAILALILCTPVPAIADGLVGELAPEPEISEWLLETEGATLEELRGQVVLLLLGEAGETRVEEKNDLRAAYLEDGLRIVAVVAGGAPEGAEFAVAKGAASAYGDGPLAVLVAADGEIAWTGAPGEIPEDDLPALLRKSRARSRGDEGGSPVAAWTALAGRALARSDLAEAHFWLQRAAKELEEGPRADEIQERIRELRDRETFREEIRASENYVRLREEWRRAGDDDRKLDRWRKKAERIVTRYPDTVGAARVARLLEAGSVDPAIAAIREFIAREKVDVSGADWRTSLPKPPQVRFSPGRAYFWILETDRGRMRLRLHPDVAPMHVSSTIYLSELGFYDGLTFHRVIPGFMAQGGCPLGTGAGMPGYQYDGEFDDGTKHDRRGILSMAHAGPGTDGSQFFITFRATANLDGRHTVFGELVDGEETLAAIEKLGTPGGQTIEKIVIEKATIVVE